jgi:AcrR family transcriptional regulator
MGTRKHAAPRVRMKSEDRRAAIVRSAILVFAEKGFRGATTRELAQAAGVTEPVLYQHFAAKSDLYSAIIEAKAGEVLGNAEALAKLAESRDDRAFLGAIGELILRRYQEDPQLGRLLLFGSLERHELSDLFFERLYSAFYKLVAGYIRGRVREGAFRKVNPEVAARGLIGMISYHGLVTLLFPKRFSIDKPRAIADQMVSVFLDGIYRPEEPKPPAPRTESERVDSSHSTGS